MHQNIKLTLAITLSAAALSGCGNLNSALAQRSETVEMYHIFDFKTKASPDAIIKGAADGLARNTNSVVQSRPLQMNAGIPANPGRFELVDAAEALKGTGMGAIFAMSQSAGNTPMRSAKCNGAVWTAKALRDVAGSDRLNLYSCIYRYKEGYQLDVYAVFQKTSGGLAEIGRGAAQALVGTPEQWANKTIIDTVRSIEAATGARSVRLEGQPELGDLPAVDSLDKR